MKLKIALPIIILILIILHIYIVLRNKEKQYYCGIDNNMIVECYNCEGEQCVVDNKKIRVNFYYYEED